MKTKLSGKAITYQQCSLKRNNMETVSWIPSKYAISGNYLQLKDRATKEWVNGWQVIGVGSTLLDEQVVRERETDWKRTRKASDI